MNLTKVAAAGIISALGLGAGGIYLSSSDIANMSPNSMSFLQKLDKVLLGGHYHQAHDFKHSEGKFLSFITKYGRQYVNQDEYKMRFVVYSKNLKFIENHDAEKAGSGVKENHLMDWTDEEYASTAGYKPNDLTGHHGHPVVEQAGTIYLPTDNLPA